MGDQEKRVHAWWTGRRCPICDWPYGVLWSPPAMCWGGCSTWQVRWHRLRRWFAGFFVLVAVLFPVPVATDPPDPRPIWIREDRTPFLIWCEDSDTWRVSRPGEDPYAIWKREERI